MKKFIIGFVGITALGLAMISFVVPPELYPVDPAPVADELSMFQVVVPPELYPVDPFSLPELS